MPANPSSTDGMATPSPEGGGALGLSASTGTAATATAIVDAETLSPLEQEVLDEYASLLGNLNNLSDILAELAANPSPQILDALRGLERKTSLVFTLLKASVYSIVLQQQIGEEEGGGGGARTE